MADKGSVGRLKLNVWLCRERERELGRTEGESKRNELDEIPPKILFSISECSEIHFTGVF